MTKEDVTKSPIIFFACFPLSYKFIFLNVYMIENFRFGNGQIGTMNISFKCGKVQMKIIDGMALEVILILMILV